MEKSCLRQAKEPGEKTKALHRKENDKILTLN